MQTFWIDVCLCACVTRSRPLSLCDLQRALQSGTALHEGLVFSGGVVDLVEDGDALRLLPTAVRLLIERASHSDWMLRTAWLSSLAKSYKHAPGRGAPLTALTP